MQINVKIGDVIAPDNNPDAVWYYYDGPVIFIMKSWHYHSITDPMDTPQTFISRPMDAETEKALWSHKLDYRKFFTECENCYRVIVDDDNKVISIDHTPGAQLVEDELPVPGCYISLNPVMEE